MDYHARYYDAAVGRFLSADTIVPEPGNPQDLNRYSYVRNNALKYTDPSGHSTCLDGECNWVEHPVTEEIVWRGSETRHFACDASFKALHITTQTSHASRDWEVLRFGTPPAVTGSGRPGLVLRASTSQGTGSRIVLDQGHRPR